MKSMRGLILLGVFALLLAGCNGKNLAVVNTDAIYQKSAASEKGTAYLKGVSSELENNLGELQKKAESSKDKKAAQAELQQALMAIQQRFNAEQQQVITTLSDLYKKALENCRTKYKIDLIFASDTALSYDKNVDVTDKVLEEMNALPVEFKPLNAENAAKEPAAQ